MRPNGWMDEVGTWHGRRPQPRRLCVGWGPSPLPLKGAEPPSPIFGLFLLWPNGCMHQNATWYGAIGLGPGDFVLDVDSAPPVQKGGGAPPPQFSAHVYCG